MNHTLIELVHAGLFVHLWDNDTITTANLGRQRFAEYEVGLYKSATIINRINRWAGKTGKPKQESLKKTEWTGYQTIQERRFIFPVWTQ